MVGTDGTPETLWHYTDANGLFGIMASGQLRFGDARFLNDRTERLYGVNVRKQILKEAKAVGDPHGLVAGVDAALDYFGDDRLYLCSFSATKESISQWQRYGADGAGYCLGFDAGRLDTILKADNIRRLPIIYDPEVQRTMLRRSLSNAVEQYEDWVARMPEQEHKLHWIDAAVASDEIDQVEMQFKNRFFEDEAEWRYFVRVDTDRPATNDLAEQFAARGAYIKPFVMFPKQNNSSLQLPLTHVVCGPKLDWELAETTVKRFLASCDNGFVTVERSQLAEIWR